MINGTESPVLVERFSKYIDPSTCRKTYTDGFNRYVTFDKFCIYSELGNNNLDIDCSD